MARRRKNRETALLIDTGPLIAMLDKDASLVVVAESLDLRRVFMLDDDFYIYRLADGSTLEIVR